MYKTSEFLNKMKTHPYIVSTSTAKKANTAAATRHTKLVIKR